MWIIIDSKKTKKISPALVVVCTLLIVLIVLAAVAIYLFLKNPASATNEDPPQITYAPEVSGGRGIVVTPDNVEEIREQLNQPIDDAYYTTTMNVEWIFPNSNEPSTNAYVENDVMNTRTVYFDLTLADTGQLVYSSPFIPVGAKIQNFKLDAQLSVGEYKGIVTYHLVDDEFLEITTVSVSVILKVLA